MTNEYKTSGDIFRETKSSSSNSMVGYLKNLKNQDAIIGSQLDDWFIAHPELEITDEDLETIRRLMAPRGERISCFTGSQAGSCERRQIFGFLGLPGAGRINPELANRYMDGTWRHVRWMLILPKAVPGLQVEQRVDAPSFHLRGSFDLVHRTEGWAGEIKGTSAFTKLIREGVFPAHQQQAARYLIASDEDPSFPSFNTYVYFYEDKMSNQWREIVVKRDGQVERFVRAELRRLNSAVTNQELPGIIPPCKSGKGPFFRECPYSHDCLLIESWSGAEQIALSGTRRGTGKPQVRQPAVGLDRRKVRKPVRTGDGD